MAMCTENYHWHHDYVRLAWDSGFAFNIHRIKVNQDWSSIGLLDIDRVIRDRDVAILEKHMLTILNYCLDDDQTRILDPTFVKIFQLSQLSVQYLQFCKRYLDNTVVLLKKELSKYKEDNVELNNSVEQLKTEVYNLKKKVKELKQSVQVQQPQSVENVLPTSFKCTICSKLFVSEDFLVSHVKRRHEVDSNPFQTETDRLQLEIKELKERLNSTEKYIQGDHNTKVIQESQESIPNNDEILENATHVNDLKDKFDNLKQFVERELMTLRDEKHYQEKYEKWFDTVFHRLDNSRKELQEKEDKLKAIGDGDRLSRKESSTQTIPESFVETETMTDELPCNTSEEKLEAKPVQPVLMEIDVEKIEHDIKLNTETHLDQIQGALEKKLSGGFEQIQTQMNSFWKKLSDMELEKHQTNPIQTPHKNISNTSNIIRSHIKTDKKQRSSSISSASSSESLEKPEIKVIQPKPAPRITKNFPPIIQSRPREKIPSSPLKAPTIVKTKPAKKFQRKFSEDTSSDEVFQDSKPSLKISSERGTLKFNRAEVIGAKSKSAPKPEKVKYKGDTESSSSETEQETLSEEPQVKPSNTSTLGQRSVTSLKHMVKDKDVIKGLKKELEEMLNLRLKEMGISPNWSGLPEKSFEKAITVVRHQSELSRKKYSTYSKAREMILKILNEKVRTGKKPEKQNPMERKKKEKVLIIKQPIIKKQTKHEKKSAKPADTTYIVDLNSEDSNTKVNIFRKEDVKKDYTKESPINAPQENTVSVSATPIKKKVLFDLEDSSSTSKVNIGNVNIPQSQQSSSEEKGQTVTVVSPVKVQNAKEANILKVSSQKSQNITRINDGGSTTSLASSLLEVQNAQTKPVQTKMQNFTKEDTSDWDISDILT